MQYLLGSLALLLKQKPPSEDIPFTVSRKISFLYNIAAVVAHQTRGKKTQGSTNSRENTGSTRAIEA